MAIYITGDTHIPYDLSKLNSSHFPDQRHLTKEDIVIICGDFGGVWNGGQREQDWLDWLEDRPFTVCFCCGNHENFELLETFPVRAWHGGRVHQIRPTVYHLMRGELFQLEGQTFFVLGGADSPDKRYRKENVNWWPQEIPNDAELSRARQTLDQVDWCVDYIVTHTAPTWVVDRFGFVAIPSPFQDFLDELNQRGQFKGWFFGHFHVDQVFPDRMRCFYDDIERLPEGSIQDER